MAKIAFNNTEFVCRDGETILEASLRLGIEMPFSCRKGVCHACLLRAVSGEPTADSQQDVEPLLRDKDYFLPCKCVPVGDMTLSLPDKRDYYSGALVSERDDSVAGCCTLTLVPFDADAVSSCKQLNIRHPDGSYRRIEVIDQGENGDIRLQIDSSDAEPVSTWLFYEVAIGDELQVQAVAADDSVSTAHATEKTDNNGGQVCSAHNSVAVVPDAEMWAALDEGRLLGVIMNDFYTIVYDDPKLAPFFEGITKQRSVEKQFLFMRQLFTGEKVYFGDRPKNAHHWMVISDELFDYRERLMEQCLRKHNLPEHLIKRWLDIDESFRKDIVKSEAIPRIVNGVEMPLDGFGEVELEIGSLCDGCSREVMEGETVRYHLRLGTIYCQSCASE